MNWAFIRCIPWIDTRARFVGSIPSHGTLRDLGSSDGETLGHIFELRPDLSLHSSDLAGNPERYPRGCLFHRVDFEKDRIPMDDASVDAITCMHVVEHLHCLDNLFREISRLLVPGGRVYLETPHPNMVNFPPATGRMAGKYTLNFFDDPTHLRPVPSNELAVCARQVGLAIVSNGTSRNFLFAFSYFLFFFLPVSRKRLTAYTHLRGWSVYLIAEKPTP